MQRYLAFASFARRLQARREWLWALEWGQVIMDRLMLARRQFAPTDIMIITLMRVRPMAITARNGLQTAYSLAWARGTTGIGIIPASMAEASTAAAGAIAGSADVAGIMTVSAAAGLSTKALDAAASMVANFMVAADFTEVVKAFTGAEDFMAVAATEVAMAPVNDRNLQATVLKRILRTAGNPNCQPFFFWSFAWKILRVFLP